MFRYVVLLQPGILIDWVQGKGVNDDARRHGNSKTLTDQPGTRAQVYPCIVGLWEHHVVALNGRIFQISSSLDHV